MPHPLTLGSESQRGSHFQVPLTIENQEDAINGVQTFTTAPYSGLSSEGTGRNPHLLLVEFLPPALLQEVLLHKICAVLGLRQALGLAVCPPPALHSPVWSWELLALLSALEDTSPVLPARGVFAGPAPLGGHELLKRIYHVLRLCIPSNISFHPNIYRNVCVILLQYWSKKGGRRQGGMWGRRER